MANDSDTIAITNALRAIVQELQQIRNALRTIASRTR